LSRRLHGKRALIYGGGTELGYPAPNAWRAKAPQCSSSGGGRAASERQRRNWAGEKLGRIGLAGYAAGAATVEANLQRLTASAVSFMGGLDTMVNSAGTSGVASILKETLANFKRVSEANLFSTFLSSRGAAPHMVENGSGSIIAVSSMYGVVGQYPP
jgi:NAD(P)-dependent dehydrogenase (short-subunit alcohol dehydrogenase family)